MLSWSMALLLLSGVGNDLLDLLPSGGYWQARSVEMTADNLLAELKTPEQGDVPELIRKLGARQHEDREDAQRRLLAKGPGALPQLLKAAESADAETAARIRELVRTLSSKGRAQTARRLMAIRGLGELKDRRALPALRKLLGAEAPFEAEYARRAIASIEGKPFKPTGLSAKAMASDLWLLPRGCGVVGQAALRLGRRMTTEQVVKDLAAALPAGDAEAAIARINQVLTSVAEKVGNFRLSAVTCGVAEDVGDRSGYVVVVARGLCDAAGLREALLEQQAKPEMVGATEVLRLGGDAAVILASNERVVFMVGPSREQLPVGDMVAALKAGTGKLAENEAMAGLVKAVRGVGPAASGPGTPPPAAPPVWAVCRVSEAYRKLSLLAPFKSLTFTATQRADQLNFALQAKGTDAELVRAAAAEFNRLMDEGRREMAREAERMPPLKPLAELIDSIKAQSDGPNATATAFLKGDLRKLFVMPLLVIPARQAHVEQQQRIMRQRRVMRGEGGQPVPAP